MNLQYYTASFLGGCTTLLRNLVYQNELGRSVGIIMNGTLELVGRLKPVFLFNNDYDLAIQYLQTFHEVNVNKNIWHSGRYSLDSVNYTSANPYHEWLALQMAKHERSIRDGLLWRTLM